MNPFPRSRSLPKLLVLLMLVSAGAFLFWPGSSQPAGELVVTEGMGASQVASVLHQKGLLRSPLIFKVWVRLRGAGSRIRVGRYQFNQNRSAYWIVDDLINGRTQKTKVIIPEGFASWQIAERLEENQICPASAFKNVVAAKQLEGFLYPATYDFDIGLSAPSVADQMVARFNQGWTEEFNRRAAEIGFSKKEVVTLASIVEREARDRSESPLIAAVYTNRLKKRMRLEADPTVQFALGYWKSRLTYRDYRTVQSPYNTYINGGLPPGPICSPGIDAIRAALWPAVSDALYFVATEDGRHSFSTNYRDHTNKVNKRNRLKRSRR